MLNDQCYSDFAALTSVEDLITTLKRAVNPILDTCDVALDDALGRVLAAEIVSEINLPPFDNAAVDGFAFCYGDLRELPYSLPISATIKAGEQAPPLQQGNAARIMTGAALPEHADTVVMREDVQVSANQVLIPSGVKGGANCRPAGEDVAVGQRVFAVGEQLDFSAIGMLAALGHTRVNLYRPVKVALFSSGDEITESEQGLAAGQRFDANRPMLRAFLQRLGYEVFDGGILPDDLTATEEALVQAATEYDVIVTSGGASTGDADFLIRAVQQCGHIEAWRVALKPGRPLAFGNLQEKPILCLPGNPVAVGVCALIFLVPFLAALSGRPWPKPVIYPLAADFKMKKKTGRTEYVRAMLKQTEKGLRVSRHPKQGSGVLMSLVEGDGLVYLPSDCAAVEVGDVISFLPFDQFY